jgi:hypothetical protein
MDRRSDQALFPIMPYYVLHNMSDSDADAIVAYLRTILPVANAIPARNFMLPAASPPVPLDRIPNPTIAATHADYESAMRGKYLAGNFGMCMECHTKHVQTPGAVPLDLDKLFAGGENFISAAIGLPPSFPSVITTLNLTPHATGLQGWTAGQVANVLKNGVDKDGLAICPPMPNGPNGAFGGMTDNDARDIGTYLIHLAPIDNAIALACHDVMGRDGGRSDGGPDVTDSGPTPPDSGPDSGPDTPAPPPDVALDVARDVLPDATGDGAPDTSGPDAPSDATTDTTGDGATGDGATDGAEAGDGPTGDGSSQDGATDGTTG